ncbi:MAG TPA: MATE family efflux transporter, partial [Planctomycetota bacterium]|nr:MATE family efflux transporter [Planctomycetota bacterium]
ETQFGQMALNVVDVAMLGHYDAAALPAMSLGNTLCWAVMTFCMGAITAVDPLLAQAVGARDRPAITRTLLRGYLLAALLALPAMLLLLPSATWLSLLGQKDALVPGGATYAQLNTLGFLPFLWYSVTRSWLSSHSRLWPQVLTIVLGNGLNALLDWAWIYGHLGCPELGVAGAAWATVVSRWTMLVLLLLASRRELAPHLRHFTDAAVRRDALALRPLWRLFRLGAPIGAQFALEMGVFALTALLVGRCDAAAGSDELGGPRLGGHQIALQLAALSFMVPLGLGMGASVRVGWAVGRGDMPAARQTAVAALLAGAGVMSGFMALFLSAPAALAQLFTDQADIVYWAVRLIPLAGVFQIGDGLQVVSIGCLRGIGDVRSPMLINVVGFWLLGLPLGCWLGLQQGHGPQGLWWGLVAGLFVVAVSLLWMVRRRFLGQHRRLGVD